ncbi:cytochrome [Nocardia farcinica]|nr:cytochrome [Nocardia farcinica]
MTQTVPRFNPFGAEFRADPYPMYRGLRETRPVHRTLGMWVLTSHSDVRAALRDKRLSSSLIPDQVAARIEHLPDDVVSDARRIVDLGRTSLVFTDDPAHARLRALVNRVFTRSRIEALRPIVAQVVDAYLDDIDAASDTGVLDFDLVRSFATPLPVEVLCEWMALPTELRGVVGAWTHEVRHLLEPSRMSPEDYARVGGVVGRFAAALVELIEARVRKPGHDLVSELAAAEIGGGDRLDADELAHVGIMCFIAGTETTSALIGNAAAALLDHPEQSVLLAADPGRAGDAITETLRYDAPLQMTTRVARSEVEYGGQVIAPGDRVLLCLGAANRDPAVFESPDEFRMGRGAEPGAATAHLGFGHGMHGCLGAALARLTAESAIESLWRRFELALGAAEATWQKESYIMRGHTSFPVTGRRR